MRRIRVGDQVQVISGEHKGARGKVAKVDHELGRVVVEGVNQVRRHVKPTQQRAGGIVTVEAPLAISKVMPVDPESDKPTRVRIQEKDGKKVRVAKSGAVIVSQR
jgi:large subunit ribosomal protein L24